MPEGSPAGVAVDACLHYKRRFVERPLTARQIARLRSIQRRNGYTDAQLAYAVGVLPTTLMAALLRWGLRPRIQAKITAFLDSPREPVRGKACPFCGKSLWRVASVNNQRRHYVVCDKCHARGPRAESIVKAVTLWAKRRSLQSD
jgi:predicted RNA-binding Zn-ribbon protein involved in translation (DUF1610 family)